MLHRSQLGNLEATTRMSIPISSKLRKRPNVVSRALEDARIALRLDRTETLVFNASASDLWQGFENGRSVAEVAADCGQVPDTVAAFAAELIELSLFDAVPASAQTSEPQRAANTARKIRSHTDAPRLLAREDLAVMGGCTSSSTACATPGSSIGGGQGQGNPPGPPNPPPGLNK